MYLFANFRKTHLVVAVFSCLLLLTVAATFLGVILHNMNLENNREATGVVVANGMECAVIGKRMLDLGGSAVDAAIAAALCDGVCLPESLGIGGGFLMTIYIRSTGEAVTLNAREVAPSGAHEDMFVDNPHASSEGGLSIAVPGELRGYEEAHKRFGKLPWSVILYPIIKLCKHGHKVNKYFAGVLDKMRDLLIAQDSFREIFINPSTDEPYAEGDIIKRPVLARTLELVARDGADVLYNGSLTDGFVRDIIEYGGIITKEDMETYKPEWSDPISTTLNGNRTLHTIPLPGSGPILAHMLNLLRDNVDRNGDNILNYHRIVETFKLAYGVRSRMGDYRFVEDMKKFQALVSSQEYANLMRSLIKDNSTSQDPDYYGAGFSTPADHGTAHICVLAPNGDAVAVTSTINLQFGSKRRSKSTGIILNDQMDDFSSRYDNFYGLPPSPSNYIQPGKRPMSSMSPTIIVNADGSVRMVIGGAGGSRITTSVALIIVRHLQMNYSFEEAMRAERLHHQLLPMQIDFEQNFDEDIVNGLSKIGHRYTISGPSAGFVASTGISSLPGKLVGMSDPRRPGSTEYIYG